MMKAKADWERIEEVANADVSISDLCQTEIDAARVLIELRDQGKEGYLLLEKGNVLIVDDIKELRREIEQIKKHFDLAVCELGDRRRETRELSHEIEDLKKKNATSHVNLDTRIDYVKKAVGAIEKSLYKEHDHTEDHGIEPPTRYRPGHPFYGIQYGYKVAERIAARDEIAPCPNCKAEEQKEWHHARDGYHIGCGCGVVVRAQTRKEMLRIWNSLPRRVWTPEQIERAKEKGKEMHELMTLRAIRERLQKLYDDLQNAPGGIILEKLLGRIRGILEGGK
jgi:hypothetical protein